jgi:hypothetical protein
VRICDSCAFVSPCIDIIPTELGINFSHIGAKSMTVLNPFRRVNEHIMDDADLAGPLIFCFCFATFLLFVRVLSYATFYTFRSESV